MDDYDAFILVDAVPRGESAGTLYMIEPDLAAINESEAGVEAHGMNPMRVLAMAKTMGARPKGVLLIGCEPADLEERIGLSDAVSAAVDGAVEMIEALMVELAGQVVPPAGVEASAP
jgi:hydrogenase maturation protease